MMRQALTRDHIPPMTLDICVAHSQGGIAYLLMQAIENALREADNGRHVACLLTQVEVDLDDAAFKNPTKFVGPLGGTATEKFLMSYYHPPFNRVSNYRDPGRVNINTIAGGFSLPGSPVWNAILNGGVGPAWQQIVSSRSLGFKSDRFVLPS